MKPEVKKRLLQIAAIFAFYTVLSAYYSTQSLAVFLNKGVQTSFLEEFGTSLIQWLPWAFLTLFILGFAKKYPVYLKKWSFWLPRYLFAGVFFSVVHIVIYLGIVMVVQHPQGEILDLFLIVFFKSINYNLLVFIIIVSLWNLWDYNRRNQQNEIRTSQLEAKLAQAELDVLRMQLNPHFLFNTLHMITAYVRKDPDVAETMIDRLSDLLRKTLETSDSAEIPLKEELEYVKIYLEIQKCRFQGRMREELNIAPDTLDVNVPSLILQPLIENAVQYAVAPQALGGKITVSSRKKEQRILLEIKDGGPGFPEGTEAMFKKGRGLSNTRERLQLHYGDSSSFVLENNPGGGALVRLEIPILE
jgi:signal transduction histidine kinase